MKLPYNCLRQSMTAWADSYLKLGESDLAIDCLKELWSSSSSWWDGQWRDSYRWWRHWTICFIRICSSAVQEVQQPCHCSVGSWKLEKEFLFWEDAFSPCLPLELWLRGQCGFTRNIFEMNTVLKLFSPSPLCKHFLFRYIKSFQKKFLLWWYNQLCNVT